MIGSYARHKARKLAIQALYQWQVTQDPVDYILPQFLATANPKKIDLEYFSLVVPAVVQEVTKLDDYIRPLLDRDIASLDTVELAVLRLAVYELAQRLDIPYRVVIDEALKLTKIFGSVDGFKYVNGILDKIAKTLRRAEIEAVLHK